MSADVVVRDPRILRIARIRQDIEAGVRDYGAKRAHTKRLRPPSAGGADEPPRLKRMP
jgi:hypothetical protein